MAKRKAHRSNADAIQATLDHLDSMGRLEDVDSAIVRALESMARALDDDPGNAALWRQYRETLGELVTDDSGPVSDELEDLLSPSRDEA